MINLEPLDVSDQLSTFCLINMSFSIKTGPGLRTQQRRLLPRGSSNMKIFVNQPLVYNSFNFCSKLGWLPNGIG